MHPNLLRAENPTGFPWPNSRGVSVELNSDLGLSNSEIISNSLVPHFGVNENTLELIQ